MPDMNTSFRSEPRIPRRTSCKKDIGVTSSVYGSTRRRCRLSAATYAEAEARTDPAPRRPFDAAGWPGAAEHKAHQRDSARKRGEKRGKTKKAASAANSAQRADPAMRDVGEHVLERRRSTLVARRLLEPRSRSLACAPAYQEPLVAPVGAPA
jgi:hypothetical protein